MTFKTTLNTLWDFEAWSGGEDNLNKWKETDPDFVDYLTDYLDEFSTKDDPWTETEINDFLWFDAEDLYKQWKS